MVIYGHYSVQLRWYAEFLHHIYLLKVDGGLSF